MSQKISLHLSFLIYRTGEMGNLTAPCNANCNCLRSYYYPLCGSDGIQYFSPCFAGCLNSVSNRKPKVAMFPLYLNEVMWTVCCDCCLGSPNGLLCLFPLLAFLSQLHSSGLQTHSFMSQAILAELSMANIVPLYILLVFFSIIRCIMTAWL